MRGEAWGGGKVPSCFADSFAGLEVACSCAVLPIEFAMIMCMFCSCTAQYGSYQQHASTDHLLEMWLM